MEVRLDDLFENPAWRHQTGSSFLERCLMFLTIGPASGVRQQSRKHVGDTGNPSGNYFRFGRHYGMARAPSEATRERRRQQRCRRDPKGPAGKFFCPVKLRRRCRLLLPVRCRHGGSRLLATRSKRDTSRSQDVRPFTNRPVNNGLPVECLSNDVIIIEKYPS